MSTAFGEDRAIRRAIATVCLSGTLEDKLDAVGAAGFDGVEIFENDLIASSSTPAEVRSAVPTWARSIEFYQPFLRVGQRGRPDDSAARRTNASTQLSSD